jgi:hypothetical protein
LSSSSSKAGESLNNSAYYSFYLSIYNYVMDKMMSPSMFTFRIISCDLRLHVCVWVV